MANITVKNNLMRQSNFELLRIIAMLFIVMRHFVLYGGLDETGSEIMLNKVFVTFVRPLGKLGVDIFILISGYFLAGKSKVTVKKNGKAVGTGVFLHVQHLYYQCNNQSR